MPFGNVRDCRTYNMEKVCKMAVKTPAKLAKLCENNYENKVLKIVNKIMSTIDSKNIILIAGPSASGKTTSSHIIVSELEKRGVPAIVVSMDNFFIERKDTFTFEDGTKDYDNIASLDIALFKKCMDNLINDKFSMMPIFDFITGNRDDEAYNVEITSPKTAIIVEGIHAFNPLCMSDLMRGRCQKVYICVASDFQTESGLLTHETLRFCRRMIRDFYHRGSDVENTEQLWRHVRESEEQFVVPFKSSADFIIDTTHAYEPLLYKDELLKIAKMDENALKYLNFFLNDVDYSKQNVGKNALVWEFLTSV
ncbi:MAG: hypothetical protein ACI4TX_00170 [Christensenellales bacterium]